MIDKGEASYEIGIRIYKDKSLRLLDLSQGICVLIESLEHSYTLITRKNLLLELH